MQIQNSHIVYFGIMVFFGVGILVSHLTSIGSLQNINNFAAGYWGACMVSIIRVVIVQYLINVNSPNQIQAVEDFENMER